MSGTRKQWERLAEEAISDAGEWKRRARELELALHELLQYTGGSDVTDTTHPIYKARKALGLEPNK